MECIDSNVSVFALEDSSATGGRGHIGRGGRGAVVPKANGALTAQELDRVRFAVLRSRRGPLLLRCWITRSSSRGLPGEGRVG
jgi:hypothetical protein